MKKSCCDWVSSAGLNLLVISVIGGWAHMGGGTRGRSDHTGGFDAQPLAFAQFLSAARLLLQYGWHDLAKELNERSFRVLTALTDLTPAGGELTDALFKLRVGLVSVIPALAEILVRVHRVRNSEPSILRVSVVDTAHDTVENVKKRFRR